MSRLVPILTLGACLAVAVAHADGPQRPLYDSGFFEPSESVVTPHITWAKPYSRGAPKVLFLTHRNAMREVIELAERVSLDYKVFACDGPDRFGETGIGVDASWKLIRGNSSEELAEQLRGDLKRDYDVIAVGNVNWDALPLDCRYEILKKVKAGTGLVGAMPGGHDQYLDQILKTSDFAWHWGLWSGGAQGVADYFGVGVFDGTVDFTAAHSGKASLRIAGTQVKQGSREPPRAGYSPGEVKLEPNTEYVFSMWTKTQGLKDGGALVSLHPQPAGVPVPASEDWKLSEVRFKTDDKKLSTGVYLLNYNVGTVWYDDVKLAKAGEDKNLLPNAGFENPGPLPESLAAGFPFKSLPAFASGADAQAFLAGTLQVTQFGAGRVGLARFGVPLHQMMTPGPSGPVQNCRLDYDYYLALAAKLILWGAKREPDVAVSAVGGPLITGDRAALAAQPLTFRLQAGSPVSRAWVDLKVRGRPNRIWHEASQTVDLKAGDNSVAFPVPALPRGDYFADLWVKSGDATVAFGSVGLSVAGDARIKEVALGKSSFALSEPLSGRAVIENAPAGSVLRLRARDWHGRLVAEAAKPAAGEVAFTVPMPPSLSIVGQLDAELVNGKDTLDVRTVGYSINNLNPDHQDAEYVMWITYPNDFLGPLMAEQFTRLGVDAQYGGGGDAGYAPYANQWWLPYATRFTDSKTDWYQPRPTRAKDDLVRDPCLTNPEYRKSVAEDLTKTAQAGLAYSTSEFTLGDENLFVSGPFDLCFSDTCIADFRRWAQEVYGSLDKLNAEWGSSFASWDQVRPQTLEECKKTGNYVPWVDHRLHMESVWAGMHGFSRDTIRKVVPNARVGYEGSDTSVSSWQADDYWKLAHAMNLNNIYYRDFLSLVWYDFAAPDMLLGAGWYGGYPNCRNEPFMRWFPWRTLFKGANSFWVWQGYGDAGSVMAFDLSPYPFFKAGCEEVAEIKAGPGKLLVTASREHDGIALLYSASSVHVATYTPGFPDTDATLNNLVKLLHDTGLECRVVSYADLAQGKVTNREFKVLLLPGAQALSAAEAEKVRQFAAGGGTVIADLRPGVTDEHGKPYAAGCLDDLFGVTQGPAFKQAQGSLDVAGAPESSGAALKLDGALHDASLTVKAGRALAQSGETAVLVTNPSGKGRSLLLNLSLNGYASLPKKPGTEFAGWPEGAAYRDFIRGLMKAAGVTAPVAVAPDAPEVEVSRFRNGGAEYIGIIQGLPVDTMLYTNRVAEPPKPRAVTIRFDRRAHVYDVRAGKYLGQTDTLQTEMTGGLATLYALLPYKVDQVGVAAAKECRAGESLAWQAKVHAAGGVGNHVLRLQVFGPDGKERPYYAKNLSANGGEASGAVHLALDDPAGVWKLVVKDVATGVTGSTQVKVTSR